MSNNSQDLLQQIFSQFIEVDQEEIIQTPADKRIIVNAGPGTGKTYSLIEKIIYFISEEHLEPSEIFALCFSRSAVEVIESRLEKAEKDGQIAGDWREIDIRTFDSFATYLIAAVLRDDPDQLPKNFQIGSYNYEQRIQWALSLLLKNRGIFDEYRHFIVDEVQDLVGTRAQLVLEILNILPAECGFTVLGDYCQALYDYLVNPNLHEIESADFYSKLITGHPEAVLYKLGKNHRQNKSYSEMLDPFREDILTGTEDDREADISRITGKINSRTVDLLSISNEEFNRYRRSGSIGILTRSNAEALIISSRLREKHVDHLFLHERSNGGYGDWIANVFLNYPHETICYDNFKELFSKLYSGLSPLPYWKALLSTQTGQTGKWIDVEKLLKGVLFNPRDPLLYKSANEISSNLTVCTVHRAKGREFDNVFVLDKVFDSAMNSEADRVQEERVCYVAVTRPKKNLYEATINNQYIYCLRDGTRRNYRTAYSRYSNKKFLSNIEFGFLRDLDDASFALSSERQNRIRSLKRGDELALFKNDQVSFREAPYVVFLKGETIPLGGCSQLFRYDVNEVTKSIWNRIKDTDYDFYPKCFDNIYVEGLTSCISNSRSNLRGAKTFGDISIWFGISAVGFAKNNFSIT